MLAGGEATDQHPTHRPKWLNVRTVALALAIGGVVAVPVVLQVKQLLLAEATWPGAVGASIYRQGQDYSKRVAAIERQDALGWTVNVTIITARETGAPTTFEVEIHDRDGKFVPAREPVATFIHPMQELLDHGPVRVETMGVGRYRVQTHLPSAGRWQLRFAANAPDGSPFRRDFDVVVPSK